MVAAVLLTAEQNSCNCNFQDIKRENRLVCAAPGFVAEAFLFFHSGRIMTARGLWEEKIKRPPFLSTRWHSATHCQPWLDICIEEQALTGRDVVLPPIAGCDIRIVVERQNLSGIVLRWFHFLISLFARAFHTIPACLILKTSRVYPSCPGISTWPDVQLPEISLQI